MALNLTHLVPREQPAAAPLAGLTIQSEIVELPIIVDSVTKVREGIN